MKSLYFFTATYLLLGGLFFIQKLNLEFVIYVGVIIVILGGVFATQRWSNFPLWMLWMLSIWGLFHVLGGAVPTQDGVLFAYRFYPFLDYGGEFYILKYDQVVHFYLYGLVAVMSAHLLTARVSRGTSSLFVATVAILTSLGISSLNEIMEFLIAVSLASNGVGGYENTLLDLIFNFSGACVAIILYYLIKDRITR